MGKLIHFNQYCLYLLACCCLLTVTPAVSAPVVLKIKFHHTLSSLLVRGTPTQAQMSADGGNGATDAVFYIRSGTDTGSYTYESVEHPDNYLIVDNQGSFSLGSKDGKIHQFKNTVLGSIYTGLYADVPAQTHRCYLAFDINGNQVSNPCASDIDTEQAKLTVLSVL